MSKKEMQTIIPSATILDAMRVIDKTAISTVVVVDEEKVVGMLTDGDIRRALIAGNPLDASIEPIYTRDFMSVFPDTLRSDVLDLMQSRIIDQIPIVDEGGKLQGIHTLHSILGRETRDNWCVIMAGGQGKRLGNLTKDTPKPMLHVAGKPILERIILHLMSYGIRKIFISVGYLAELIIEYFGDGSRWGCSITYLHEKKPLGSGGALSLLPEKPDRSLILVNGDLITGVDFGNMLAKHELDSCFATMGLTHYAHEVPFGCVTAKSDRIISLEEKPTITRLVNGGIYVLSPKAVAKVPRATFFPITQLFQEALTEGLFCGAYHMECDWIDIGRPDQLRLARGGT